jgi:soluble lytic murein transglycosylase
MLALGIAEASSTSRHKHVPSQRSKAAKAEHHKRGSAPEAKRSERVVEPRIPLPGDRPTAPTPQLSPDLAATKQAIALVRQRKFTDATTLAASIKDPIAQKVVEWALLRNSDGTAGFDRYAVFIQTNRDWPSNLLLRKRAEARLWNERRDAATVRRFLGERPVSAPGRLALARVLLREGDREGAMREVQMVWRSAEMSAELEASVIDAFPDQLTVADHTARMDRRIGAKDFGAAMRAAKRLGPAQVAFRRAGLKARKVKQPSPAKTNCSSSRSCSNHRPADRKTDSA